jgi:hypothetical protein
MWRFCRCACLGNYGSVARPTVAERVLAELQLSGRPLDDDELAARLGVSRRQTINQVCRILERSARLRRYVGQDGKIVNDRPAGDAAPDSAMSTPISPAYEVAQPVVLSRVQTDGVLPGHSVSVEELSAVGFRPLALKASSLEVALPVGSGCEWTTVGEVPDAAGLYAFTVEDGQDLRVVYVGLTTHLWMVTKGHLPGGAGARGGQRYGRPRHAGLTRQRVNVLIAEQLRAGRLVRHWVRPVPKARLRDEEERLIAAWNLRRAGWNRG